MSTNLTLTRSGGPAVDAGCQVGTGAELDLALPVARHQHGGRNLLRNSVRGEQEHRRGLVGGRDEPRIDLVERAGVAAAVDDLRDRHGLPASDRSRPARPFWSGAYRKDDWKITAAVHESDEVLVRPDLLLGARDACAQSDHGGRQDEGPAHRANLAENHLCLLGVMTRSNALVLPGCSVGNPGKYVRQSVTRSATRM